MKKENVIGVFKAAGCLSLCMSMGLFASCSSKWKMIKEANVPIEIRSHFAGWYDENFALSVGYSGKSYVLGSDGATWEKGQNDSKCRYCLDIVNDKIAWSGGNGTNVRVTRDGGKTWQAVTDCKIGGTHRSIDFSDCFVGWVATDSTIAKTKDGGETWKEIKHPKFNGKILSVSALSDGSGFAVTKGGDLAYTDAGGSDWKVTPVKELVNASKDGELIACDVNFEDDKNGELAASILGKTTLILYLKTQDGGESWSTTVVDKTLEGVVTDVLLSKKKNYISIVTPEHMMRLYKRN